MRTHGGVLYALIMRRHPVKCQKCSGKPAAGFRISSRGLCVMCSAVAMTRNTIAVKTKQGPEYDKWREAWLAGTMKFLDIEDNK